MFRSKKNGEKFIIFSNVEYELGFEEEKAEFFFNFGTILCFNQWV